MCIREIERNENLHVCIPRVRHDLSRGDLITYSFEFPLLNSPISPNLPFQKRRPCIYLILQPENQELNPSSRSINYSTPRRFFFLCFISYSVFPPGDHFFFLSFFSILGKICGISGRNPSNLPPNLFSPPVLVVVENLPPPPALSSYLPTHSLHDKT